MCWWVKLCWVKLGVMFLWTNCCQISTQDIWQLTLQAQVSYICIKMLAYRRGFGIAWRIFDSRSLMLGPYQFFEFSVFNTSSSAFCLPENFHCQGDSHWHSFEKVLDVFPPEMNFKNMVKLLHPSEAQMRFHPGVPLSFAHQAGSTEAIASRASLTNHTTALACLWSPL